MAELQDLLDAGVLDNFVLKQTYTPVAPKGVATKNYSDNTLETVRADLQAKIDNIQQASLDGGTY